MSVKLFVGNLSFDTAEESLKEAFAAHGSVVKATIINDKMTGRPRGFGFVEMEDKDAGMAAIDKLNDTELDGRKIVVNEARPMKPRSNNFGGGGDRGGRGGGNRDRGNRSW